jgi:hypothetical protein
MKFPLVTRYLHDLVVARLEEELKRERSRTDRAEAQLFSLLYLTESSQQLQKTVVRKEKDARMEQIEQALDANPRTKKAGPQRARLATWADREVEGGRSVEDVAEQLRTWSNVADEEDDDDDTIAI